LSALEPALDIAVSHALLVDVAAGRRPPALRLFRPRPTLAFGRLDALRPGFARACELGRERGLTPVLRSVGGHAAAFDERSLVLEHFTGEHDATAGLQGRFERQARLLRHALASLGADARVGQLPGEYCAGEYSVNVGGRLKVAGVAQRVVRHGAMTSAVVVVGGGPELRETIAAVYAALGIELDATVAGALDEAVAGVSVHDVEAALRDAYRGIAPLEPDDALLAAAARLAPRHRVA
jgi:octanoyl-[GcvH]:protein N-octanoyltransferase